MPVTKIRQLMMFRETVAACFQIQTNPTETHCMLNIVLFNVKANGTNGYRHRYNDNYVYCN
jgi:hypothetical protein